MPREVFELDNDERWQARLDEARARREIALREKAAEKSPKKRLKPWEVDGTVPDKPIEPVIQERQDDRVDFADRVETMRAVSKACETDNDAAPLLGHNSSVRAATPYVVENDTPKPAEPKPEPTREPTAIPVVQRPPAPDEFERILTTLPPAKRVVRDLQLVLPDAPPVEELALRYAATLKPETAPEPEPVAVPEVEPVPDESKSKRRRPMFMVLGISLLALNAFANSMILTPR